MGTVKCSIQWTSHRIIQWDAKGDHRIEWLIIFAKIVPLALALLLDLIANTSAVNIFHKELQQVPDWVWLQAFKSAFGLLVILNYSVNKHCAI